MEDSQTVVLFYCASLLIESDYAEAKPVAMAAGSGGGHMAKDYSQAFYHSKEWEKVRLFVLMRDRFTCQKCGRPAQEVHHKIHLSPENIWDTSITLNPDNLISLCREDHFKEHGQDRSDGHRKHNDISHGDCPRGFRFDASGQLVPENFTPPVKI